MKEKLKSYSKKYGETRLFTILSVMLIVGFGITLFWHKELSSIAMSAVFAHVMFAFIADKGNTKYGVMFYFTICVISIASLLYHFFDLVS